MASKKEMEVMLIAVVWTFIPQEFMGGRLGPQCDGDLKRW